MHEHFVFGFFSWQGDAALGGWKEDEYFQANLKVIDTAKSYGLKTIVDATTNECGRNPEFYKRLSDVTGMNIICSTSYNQITPMEEKFLIAAARAQTDVKGSRNPKYKHATYAKRK